MLYLVFIDLHNFIDLTAVGLNKECETEFPLIIELLLSTFYIGAALKWISVIHEKKLLISE